MLTVTQLQAAWDLALERKVAKLGRRMPTDLAFKYALDTQLRTLGHRPANALTKEEKRALRDHYDILEIFEEAQHSRAQPSDQERRKPVLEDEELFGRNFER